MSNQKIAKIIITLVFGLLLVVNIWPRHTTAAAACVEGVGPETSQTTHRGFPMDFLSSRTTLKDECFNPAEAQHKTDRKFLMQGLFVDLLAGGIVLMGTYGALDYWQRKQARPAAKKGSRT